MQMYLRLLVIFISISIDVTCLIFLHEQFSHQAYTFIQLEKNIHQVDYVTLFQKDNTFTINQRYP